jgi:uncharacterized protein
MSTTAVARALELPALSGHVNDYARLLSPSEARALEARLAAYERETGHQFVMVSVATTGSVAIEQYAVRLEEAWQIGDRARDDGLLLVIAAADHRMRIEVGYGLEGAIADVTAARVLDDVVAPAFRTRSYAAGINGAFDVLCRAAQSEARHTPPSRHYSWVWRWLLWPMPTQSNTGIAQLGLLVLWAILVLTVVCFILVMLLHAIKVGLLCLRDLLLYRRIRQPYWRNFVNAAFDSSSSPEVSDSESDSSTRFSGGGGSSGGGGASGNW